MFRRISLLGFIFIFLSTNLFAQMHSTVSILEKHMGYVKALNKQYKNNKLSQSLFHTETMKSFKMIRLQIEEILENNNMDDVEKMLDLFENNHQYSRLLYIPQINNMFEEYNKANFSYNPMLYKRIKRILDNYKNTDKVIDGGCFFWWVLIHVAVGICMYRVFRVDSDGNKTEEGVFEKDQERCHDCISGKVRCTDCNGTGLETCPNCNGTGYSDWQNCECDWCYGKGKVSCNRCDSTGEMDCLFCDGTGYLAPEESFTTDSL